jgi:DNA-binding transcriptional MerR regulator
VSGATSPVPPPPGQGTRDAGSIDRGPRTTIHGSPAVTHGSQAATAGSAAEPGPARERDVELTIDQLAAKVGLTVRTVRSYTTRGLLPPPRLRGRTGLYGGEHLARLSVLREMLDAGYSLAAAEQVLAAAPTGLTAPGLEVFRALLSPWQDEQPEIVDRQVLSARMGLPPEDPAVDHLAELGLARLLPGGRVELISPLLVRAGLQLAALGIRMDRVLAAQAELNGHARAMAEVCVNLFRADVWEPFVQSGVPEDGWPGVREALDRALPVASQAVLVIFRRALGEAIAAAVAEARDGGLGLFRPTPAPPPAAGSAVPAPASPER